MKWDNLVAFLKAARLTADDNTALTGMELYPVWAVGIAVAKDSRYQYNDKLYKVIQPHTTQADWTPDVAVSLFEVIDVEHSGTAEDPIPWAVNMQCYNGKYYTFDNVLYLCIRDSGIALAYTPDQLIGNYFELA